LKLKLIHENCSPELAQNRKLPYTAYIVTYKVDDKLQYDIVIAGKKVDIFDHYWDKYREAFISFKQTEGRANPRLYGAESNPEKKKK
jgi:hypothetical protein